MSRWTACDATQAIRAKAAARWSVVIILSSWDLALEFVLSMGAMRSRKKAWITMLLDKTIDKAGKRSRTLYTRAATTMFVGCDISVHDNIINDLLTASQRRLFSVDPERPTLSGAYEA